MSISTSSPSSWCSERSSRSGGWCTISTTGTDTTMGADTTTSADTTTDTGTSSTRTAGTGTGSARWPASLRGLCRRTRAALPDALGRIADDFRVRLALYRADRVLIASAGTPAPAPPEPGRETGGWQRAAGGSVLLFRLPDGRWLSAHVPRRPRGRWLGLLATLAVVIAVGAWPLARRITRRLERLQTRVDALGAGDLGARVEVEGFGRDRGARQELQPRRGTDRVSGRGPAHDARLGVPRAAQPARADADGDRAVRRCASARASRAHRTGRRGARRAHRRAAAREPATDGAGRGSAGAGRPLGPRRRGGGTGRRHRHRRLDGRAGGKSGRRPHRSRDPARLAPEIRDGRRPDRRFDRSRSPIRPRLRNPGRRETRPGTRPEIRPGIRPESGPGARSSSTGTVACSGISCATSSRTPAGTARARRSAHPWPGTNPGVLLRGLRPGAGDPRERARTHLRPLLPPRRDARGRLGGRARPASGEGDRRAARGERRISPERAARLVLRGSLSAGGRKIRTERVKSR